MNVRMRIWGAAIVALVAAAAARAADFPETHLLLVDRHAVRLADTKDDDAHFVATVQTVYRELLKRHGANLILDSSIAPAHWSGLDATSEAMAALQPNAPDRKPMPAPFVRMLFADIALSDLSDPKFQETLEHIASGQGATLVVDRKTVVLGAPGLNITALVHSSLETYRSSGTLPLVVGGPDVPPAHVAILDRAALTHSSAAGRSIVEQVGAITSKVEDELRIEGAALKRDSAALKQQLPRLAPKDRSQAVQDFNARQKAFTAKVQARQAAIAAAVAQAQKKLYTSASPIVLRLLNDGHATALLDKMAVVETDDALDITPAVIAKLDAALPHVDVVLVPDGKK